MKKLIITPILFLILATAVFGTVGESCESDGDPGCDEGEYCDIVFLPGGGELGECIISQHCCLTDEGCIDYNYPSTCDTFIVFYPEKTCSQIVACDKECCEYEDLWDGAVCTVVEKGICVFSLSGNVVENAQCTEEGVCEVPDTPEFNKISIVLALTVVVVAGIIAVRRRK
jgi:hypothetical protein